MEFAVKYYVKNNVWDKLRSILEFICSLDLSSLNNDQLLNLYKECGEKMEIVLEMELWTNIPSTILTSKMNTTYRKELSLNGVRPDILKSGIQKYIRRGMTDKALWCGVELDLFAYAEGGERIRTNFIHRLMIIFLEDVGLGGVHMWKTIDDGIKALFQLREKRKPAYSREGIAERRHRPSLDHAPKDGVGLLKVWLYTGTTRRWRPASAWPRHRPTACRPRSPRSARGAAPCRRRRAPRPTPARTTATVPSRSSGRGRKRCRRRGCNRPCLRRLAESGSPLNTCRASRAAPSLHGARRPRRCGGRRPPRPPGRFARFMRRMAEQARKLGQARVTIGESRYNDRDCLRIEVDGAVEAAQLVHQAVAPRVLAGPDPPLRHRLDRRTRELAAAGHVADEGVVDVPHQAVDAAPLALACRKDPSLFP